MKSPLAVLDFEGTSTTDQARATEVGICLVDENLRIVSEFETLIKPSSEPFRASLAKARLSTEELTSAPSFKEVWPEIHSYLNNRVIVAHNKSYEITVLTNEFRDMGLHFESKLVCTRELARKVLGHRISAENLEYLCGYFGIARLAPHEAISDARDTVHLLKKLIAVRATVQDEILHIDNIHYFTKPAWNSKSPKVRDRIAKFGMDTTVIELVRQRVHMFGFKLVVITGKPETDIVDFRENLCRHGLENRETPVTKKTAFVVRCQDNPGKSKIKKALEEGIPVIEELDLPFLLESLADGRF